MVTQAAKCKCQWYHVMTCARASRSRAYGIVPKVRYFSRYYIKDRREENVCTPALVIRDSRASRGSITCVIVVVARDVHETAMFP